MNKELIEFVQSEIKEARGFFLDDTHFNEVFDQSGWDEDNMRIFDCGLVKGLEFVLKKLQENG